MSQQSPSASKKSNLHKITVRNRPGSEDRTTTGANTQVLLDGVPLKGASFFKFEVKAAKVAKVTIEMYAIVDLDINAELEKKDEKPSGLTSQGKPINVYTLSSMFPDMIAKKE